MDLYGLALFIHILGVITLFSAFVLVQRVGIQLRAAETVEQVQSWMRILMPVKNMFASASILMLVTGLYMTWRVWTWETPWVVVGIATVVGLMGLGNTLAGPSLRKIGMTAGKSQPGPLPEELRAAVREPKLWIVMNGNNAAALGAIWIMTNKPGWVASVAIVVGLWIAGAAMGNAMAKKAPTPAVAQT